MARRHAATHPLTADVQSPAHHGAGLVRFILDHFLLLPLGAAIALVWANTAPESYFTWARTLAFPVNQIGMALFVALIMQEVLEALLPGGALHAWRHWGLVVAATAGGLAGSTVAYFGWVTLHHETVLAQAWPVVWSIDVVAGYYVVKALLPRSGALPFFLLIAIISDAAGLIVLATWPPLAVTHLVGAICVATAVTLAAIMRRRQVASLLPYLALSGPFAWLGFYWAGVHPALALVPIVPFLPHEPRRLDLWVEPPANDALREAENTWTDIAQVVVFLFGLTNAGVQLRHYDTGTWAVVLAALVGRPLGMIAFVAMWRPAGLRLPRHLGWRELAVIACATSSGFMVALFFAAAFVPIGGVQAQVKLGALATALGAVAAVIVARSAHAGRFARGHAAGRSLPAGPGLARSGSRSLDGGDPA